MNLKSQGKSPLKVTVAKNSSESVQVQWFPVDLICTGNLNTEYIQVTSLSYKLTAAAAAAEIKLDLMISDFEGMQP